jgi:hypothetical protein
MARPLFGRALTPLICLITSMMLLVQEVEVELELEAMPVILRRTWARKGRATIAKYDKHMPEILRTLEYRLRYTPRAPPQGLPDLHDGMDRQQFLGCLSTDYGPAILSQYDEYVDDMTKRHAADAKLPEADRVCPTMSSVEYWQGKAAAWPLLHKVAM